MNKKPVTIWRRWDPEMRKFKHNHFDYGQIYESYPEPKSVLQEKVWPYLTWTKSYGYIDETQTIHRYNK